MIVITKRTIVALLGGHYVYHCEGTEMIPISSTHKIEKASDEQKLMNTFKQVDLTKNFYFRYVHRVLSLSLVLIPFSYTYDLTTSLQYNLTRPSSPRMANDRFVWNYSLMTKPFLGNESDPRSCCWLLPLIHGHVDQASMSAFHIPMLHLMSLQSLLYWLVLCM